MFTVSYYLFQFQILNLNIYYNMSQAEVIRDGPLFFYWGGVTIFGTCRQFFLRVMHFVMETIFYNHF